LSDDEYRKVKETTAAYDRQQAVASAEALSGQMTPYQWRQQYTDASRRHEAALSALFHDSPQYVNGAEGMANKWQAIYEDPRVTKPDGSVDHRQLAELQAQFRAQHTPEEMSAMQGVLKKNSTKFPMLALYHHVLDAYDKWQEGYAQQNGLDVATLRGEIST